MCLIVEIEAMASFLFFLAKDAEKTFQVHTGLCILYTEITWPEGTKPCKSHANMCPVWKGARSLRDAQNPCTF